MIHKITLHLDLFIGPGDQTRSDRELDIMLFALYSANCDQLRAFPGLPMLYESGVIYQREEEGQEDWQDIRSTLEYGYGDCEDLACWRAAELRVKGIGGRKINAHPFLRYRRIMPGRLMYHVMVEWPKEQARFGRSRGVHLLAWKGKVLEDPSAALGMRGSE